MKRLHRSLLVTVATFLAVIALPATTLAAANTISATGPSTVSSDAQQVTITIQSDVGSTEVPVVDAYVSFDPSKLEYTGINYAGSPFTADTIDAATGSNYVKISRYATVQPYPTGLALLAKITFRPKVTSGTTQIGFDRPQSGLFTETGDDVLAATVSHTITFTTPVAPAPVTPTPAAPASPSAPSTPSTPATQTPTTNPGTAPSDPAAPATSTETGQSVTITENTPAAQTQGTVSYKQAPYSGSSSGAISFFAKTPVRIGLMTAVAGAVLLTAYFLSAGIRQRRYVQMAAGQPIAFPPVSAPTNTANGIMVENDPTVIQPQIIQPKDTGK